MVKNAKTRRAVNSVVRAGSSRSVAKTAARTVSKRSRDATVALARKIPGTLMKVAGKAVPYLGAAQTAYDMGNYIYSAYRGYKNSGRRRGAKFSKSAGYFGRGTKKTGIMDKCIVNGFVTEVENGDVVTSTRNVTYVAHSTMPVRQVAYTMIKALVKSLLAQSGHVIKNENESLLESQYYNGVIQILYKTKDGQIVIPQEFIVTTANTLADVNTAIFNWLQSVAGTANLPSQLLHMRYYVEFGTVATSRLLQGEIDLTSVVFTFYAQSHLKLQNRTINSTGNDTSEDVDNVPIYGKFFDYKSNGTIFKDYTRDSVTSQSAITTGPVNGVLSSTIGTEVGTNMYKEVPLPSQFVGIKKHGNAHLDPGEIKTSVMYDRLRISIQKLVNILFAKSNSTGGSGSFQQIWLGKTRLFGFEKMIQAVATTDENQFNIAFEHQLTLGCIVYHKKNFSTAPSVTQSIGNNA